MITGNLTKVGAKGLGGEIPGKVNIGIQGPPGKTPELSVGDVETLPPESPATVEISGTKEKPILNFGIPQGRQGEIANLDEKLKGYAKTEDIPKKPEDIGALPSTYIPPKQTAEQVGADPKGTAASAVSQHNTAEDSHNDIRLELKAINERLTAFFDSDNQTLDELSEIVAYITSNKSLIDAITTAKVNIADIINNLATNVPNKPLSAAQGVVLAGLIEQVRGLVPTDEHISSLIDDKLDSGGNVEDGFSPIATVEQTATGAVISITDKTGTTTATITNGKDGKDGADGQPGKDGTDGAKGDKGDKGDTGATGAQGEPGKDGANGKDGTSATHSWNGTVLTITSASGTSSADLKGAKGDQGEKGEKGDNGDKGDTGAQGIQGIQGEPGAKGDKGDTGAAGADGKTPVRGTDYWNASDIAEIKSYVDTAILRGAW